MPATADRNNTYAAAHFALELDKGEVALFRSIEGGNVRVDVMTYQMGPNYDRWRQLGKPKFEDIKLQVGMAMSQPFYKWIKDFFVGNPVRKDGAIIAADFYYKERARREFTNAIIHELTFPQLAAKPNAGPAYMTIALSVENIVFQKGNGQKLAIGDGFDAQKLWTENNFRLELAGFEDACKRVTKIDSFTIKHTIVEHHVGGQLAPIKVCSAIDFPNVAFYVPEADAQPFIDHFTNDARLHVKNEGKASPLHGTIVTYDNENHNLFTLDFTGADIFAVTPDKSDASTEEIKQVKVELYTESMSFDYAAMNVV